MDKNNKIQIEVFEEHDQVIFYSIKYLSDEYSEAEKFFINHGDLKKRKHRDDFNAITKLIENFGRDGADYLKVRPAGKKNDRVASMPGYDKKGNGFISGDLRLYAIIYSKNIVILGNGGIKYSKNYNVDPVLNEYVEVLKEVEQKLELKVKFGSVCVVNKILKGDLIFFK